MVRLQVGLSSKKLPAEEIKLEIKSFFFKCIRRRPARKLLDDGGLKVQEVKDPRKEEK